MNFIQKALLKRACIVASLFGILVSSCKDHTSNDSPFDKLEEAYLKTLSKCTDQLIQLESARSSEEAQNAFLAARMSFKQIEPILAVVDANNYESLNGPNLPKVSEEDLTDIRIKEPEGFQVLEELIYSDHPDFKTINQKATFLRARLELIRNNTSFKHRKNHHFVWMLRDAVIRTASLGITGFDSPILGQSLEEAITVYQSLSEYLSYFKDEFHDENLYDQWQESLAYGINLLTNQDFDLFDRYQFLRNVTNPQLSLISQTINDWELEATTELAVSHKADNLFSPYFFNPKHFKDPYTPEISEFGINLGRTLFYDSNLSKEKKMSCASCHKPELAFTDGQKKSIGTDGTPVKRNAPTLLYSAYQKGFFFDKRAGGLEGQIEGVMLDKQEFHTDFSTLEAYINQTTSYKEKFDSLYKDGATQQNIRNAIANYVRSLIPFQSRFDQNMRGEITNLSQDEILGFNLFMGKAACATCHFPPLFNGLLPTRYTDSEMENLGVPMNSENNEIDNDFGRYDLFKTEERKHFFKTPTIRNVALTAPYMHNGVYDSLEQVMDFYNAGGGQGLGLDVTFQTLPSDSLDLSNEEISAIISFMKTLTDPIEAY